MTEPSIEELLTPESIRTFNELFQQAIGPGLRLLEAYRSGREAMLSEYPELGAWIKALEDFDLAAASAPASWNALRRKGLISGPNARNICADSGVFGFTINSPKVLDGFRPEGEPVTDFDFTSVDVCFGRTDVTGHPEIPDGWTDSAFVDCELFEIPSGVTADNFDDREKKHAIYLCGMHQGRFVSRPVYIGIGTNEPFGSGPRRRTTPGRFRFYRYDVKDNFHLEFVRVSEGPERKAKNVRSFPDVTKIGDDHATLLLGRGETDSGFMCISDPFVAEGQSKILRDNPENRLVFREMALTLVHESLPLKQNTLPFQADDLSEVIEYAWRTHRWFFVAWQHPARLSMGDGLELYFKQLPEFRRRQYQIYKIRPELVDLEVEHPMVENLTVPHVLGTPELRARLASRSPGGLKKLERWLRNGVSRDLYSFGNHPELRLCTAMALWRLLDNSGAWSAAVESSYRHRVFELDLSFDRLLQVR